MDRVKGFLVSKTLLKGDSSSYRPLRHIRGETVSINLFNEQHSLQHLHRLQTYTTLYFTILWIYYLASTFLQVAR